MRRSQRARGAGRGLRGARRRRWRAIGGGGAQRAIRARERSGSSRAGGERGCRRASAERRRRAAKPAASFAPPRGTLGAPSRGARLRRRCRPRAAPRAGAPRARGGRPRRPEAMLWDWPGAGRARGEASPSNAAARHRRSSTAAAASAAVRDEPVAGAPSPRRRRARGRDVDSQKSAARRSSDEADDAGRRGRPDARRVPLRRVAGDEAARVDDASSSVSLDEVRQFAADYIGRKRRDAARASAPDHEDRRSREDDRQDDGEPLRPAPTTTTASPTADARAVAAARSRGGS